MEKGVHLRALLVQASRALGPRQPPSPAVSSSPPTWVAVLGGGGRVSRGGGRREEAPGGLGLALPSPAPSTGQPQAVRMFGAGAVLAGLQSFSQQFTVNSPLSVQCPEHRSLGEEGLGARATSITSSILLLPP